MQTLSQLFVVVVAAVVIMIVLKNFNKQGLECQAQ